MLTVFLNTKVGTQLSNKTKNISHGYIAQAPLVDLHAHTPMCNTNWISGLSQGDCVREKIHEIVQSPCWEDLEGGEEEYRQ